MGCARDACCSGPCTSHDSAYNATKFSMMVEMTSNAPRRTRSQAAIPHQAAPPANATSRMAGTCRKPGHPEAVPIHPAAIAPTTSWPSAPMFQKPARNATSTASPVKRSGTAFVQTVRKP